MKLSSIVVSVSLVLASVIATHNSTTICSTPVGGVDEWVYNYRKGTKHYCTFGHDENKERPWGMLNAYRSGGIETVHWKYVITDDSGCLVNWKYYEPDGKTLVETVQGKVTGRGDKGAWCALNVYRRGGKQGFQWDYCDCHKAAPVSRE